ncbi:alpha/beta hydrolase [Verticiella sediminum]|uniref:Alpha/beta hydrolase n=1 Tax=Verticiella sediminum TaxID=1247510 RepID=A0A556AVS2_9BURK|nr:alpha/beta hydrolase [Verticiella sediminum]TSH97052.1 alpha/beta hydrolase [Verticiella sediminum]
MRFTLPTPLQAVDVDGYDLNYAELGSGQPVLLVHGSLCDCRYWQPQMQPFARHGRVIAPSLRHYWPHDAHGPGEFSVEQHAHDLARLLEHLDAAPAHVVGHSRGARVALELALRHPGLVGRLVLADPPAHVADEPQAAHTVSPFIGEALRRIQAGDTEAGLGIFVDAVNGPDTWRRMVRGFREMAHDNAGTLAGQAEERIAPLDEAALAALAIPVLLVGGNHSPQRYAQAQDRLQARLPDVQRVTIVGAAHGMNIAKPHSFNTAVIAFLFGETPAA